MSGSITTPALVLPPGLTVVPPPSGNTGPQEQLAPPKVGNPTTPATPTTANPPTELPPTASSTIPPSRSVLYQSADLTIKLTNDGSPHGLTYSVVSGGQQMQFLDYDTVRMVGGTATPGTAPAGSPQAGDTQFTLTSPTMFVLSSSTNTSLPPANLEIDPTTGGAAATLTELGTGKGLLLTFNDPMITNANLSYAPTLA
jgi:hypothetical protein